MREQPAPVLVGVLRPGRAHRPVEVLEPVLVPLPVVVRHPHIPTVVQRIGISCKPPLHTSSRKKKQPHMASRPHLRGSYAFFMRVKVFLPHIWHAIGPGCNL